MQSSIRLQLTLWYVAALALTLAVLGAATYHLTRTGLYHWLDESLAERAEALSEEVQLVDGRPSIELREHGHSAYQGVSDGFLVLDGSRRVTVIRGLDGPDFAAAPAVAAAFDGAPGTGVIADQHGRRWRVSTQPLLSGGSVAAVIVVGHDLGELQELLERLGLVLVGLSPLGLLGAGIGGYLLAGRALRPVTVITDAAARISEHDLAQRLPVQSRDELGRLAATFNELIERLQHAFERQRRFTADASHELRTPLSVIQAITSQKLIRRRSPEEYEQALQQIDEAASHMGKLVNHLLILARADAGQIRLECERLDLSELVREVAAQVGEVPGHRIAVHAPGPLNVTGDAFRLTELFLNLLENAVRYTPHEGSVQVRLERRDATVRVAVSDTGSGIAAEHLPHLFERFYRADDSRSPDQGGTGLGLAISLQLAQAHGGALCAESELGRGTTMIVTLPLDAPP